MKFKDVINGRRSIRKFEKKKVSKEILKELVKDAAKAPSAMNRQPWEFYIVDSKKIRDKLSELLKTILDLEEKYIKQMPLKLQKIIYEFYENMGDCQNVIFVYTDKPRKESNIVSVAAAIENLMLSAVNKGLGTCWIGSFNTLKKEVNELLGVKNKEFVAGILVGYPKGKPLIRKKKELNEILRFV